uniref:Uncharacterized protein n=1 Tax=Schistocephalus solidus TaxID=70667 RepID=A0A0X3PX50_SCHSO
MPERTGLIRVLDGSGKGAFILINDRKSPDGETPLGQLTVKNNAVEKDGTFEAPFLIKELFPQIEFKSDKKKTVVLLNGKMGNEAVDIQFAEKADGTGNKFTLKVLPGSAVTNQFTFVSIFIVSTMLLTEI